MKIVYPAQTRKPGPAWRQAGTVLVVCLVISAIIAVTLVSYLIMTQAQNAAVARSQVWNTSIAVAEAGVEDALALMNKYAGFDDQITNWCTSASLAADHWTGAGANTYHVRRYLDSSYYDVYITNGNVLTPTIYSIGTVPFHYAGNDAPQTMLAAVGLTDATPKLLSRRLEVTTKYERLFAVAMAALQVIDFSGQNISTDSFDSADPAHSINGLYPFGQPSMILSNGDVCSDATIINSVNAGNANIKGAARTGPKGTVYLGPGGYVTGGIYDDFNVIFPDVVLPMLPWMPVSAKDITVGDKTYNYSIEQSGDYYLNSFNTTLYIASNVNARILMSGIVNMTGEDEIRIANGAQVKVYMQGGIFKAAGNGIVNENGDAASFCYFGLPSNTSVILGGNASFTGAIYAPQAAFALGGGGDDIYDFIGASVSKTVKMNGHFKFHYDENLRRIGPPRGYVATNWKEK